MRNRVTLSVAILLAGCNFAPKHVRPDLPAPAAYPGDLTPGGASANIVAVDWQGFFYDEQLRQLIARALENNRDLRVAVARIEEARGLYRIERSNLFPKLGGSADYVRNRVGTAGLGPAQASAVPPNTTLPDGFEFNQYSVGVSVTSWELDFWGRVRNLKEAARDVLKH